MSKGIRHISSTQGIAAALCKPLVCLCHPQAGSSIHLDSHPLGEAGCCVSAAGTSGLCSRAAGARRCRAASGLGRAGGLCAAAPRPGRLAGSTPRPCASLQPRASLLAQPVLRFWVSLGRQICWEFYCLWVREAKSPSLSLCSFYFCAGSAGVVLLPLEREPRMPTFFFNKKCNTC